jgi:hypothetical protein
VWFAYPKGTSKKFKCDFNRDEQNQSEDALLESLLAGFFLKEKAS